LRFSLPDIPLSDWLYTAFFLILILVLLLIFEKLSVIWNIPTLKTRKSVHLLIGIFILIAIYFIQTVYPILIIAALFSIVDWWAIRHRRFRSIHLDQLSLGTVYYPIAVFIISALLWDVYPLILIISILVLSVSDICAAIIGERYAKTTFTPYKEKKSVPGSAAMFISTLLIVTLIVLFFQDRNFSGLQILGIGFVLAVQATAAELISSRGSDNLSIPLIVALFLYLFWSSGTDYTFQQIVIGTILSLIISVISVRFGFLQQSGAITVILMGGIIFGIGGLRFAVPILVFFFLSSLLSYIKREYKQRFLITFEKGTTRDLAQTVANGGIATLIVLLTLYFPVDQLFPIYLAAICAATADTWATELGVLSWHKPRLITTGKIAEKGTSGAISITGSLAALLGSLIIFISGYVAYPEPFADILLPLIVVFSGLIGSFIDSLLGASLQVQYHCIICGKLTERQRHCDQQTIYARGIRYIDNDFVNILAISGAGILTAIYIVMRLLFSLHNS
jgi:uncharacterized protein (TIGR00297 family)